MIRAAFMLLSIGTEPLLSPPPLPLAPMPAQPRIDIEPADANCPWPLRGLVRGAASFAVFEVLGESVLLHPGDGARTPEGFVAVSSIDDDGVVLRDRAGAHLCRFNEEAS
jgi:hypothetical protein